MSQENKIKTIKKKCLQKTNKKKHGKIQKNSIKQSAEENKRNQ